MYLTLDLRTWLRAQDAVAGKPVIEPLLFRRRSHSARSPQVSYQPLNFLLFLEVFREWFGVREVSVQNVVRVDHRVGQPISGDETQTTLVVLCRRAKRVDVEQACTMPV
jgi:hypothetical protein